MSTTVHQLLESAVDRFPDRVAIVTPKTDLTYAQLYARCKSLATDLMSAGVSPGDPVGLSMPKSDDAIVAAYAIMLSGACYVPIDPFAPVERAARVAQNVELQVIVTTPDRTQTLCSEIAAVNGPLIALTPTEPPEQLPPDVVAKNWTNETREAVDFPLVSGSDLAYILHTSGSTGAPKGVAISHRNALTFVDMAAEFFDVTQDDRLCSQAPLHFDLSVFDLYVACRQGASVVVIPEFFSAFPHKMTDAIQKFEITVWNSVASVLTLMMERGKPDLAAYRGIRVVLFSGEAMPIKYLRELRRYFSSAELYNGYGQTEANTSTYYKIDSIPDNDDWRIPIGKAFPAFEVFALNNSGEEIQNPGDEGELFVRSETVAQGYWANPEATAERFVQDPRAGVSAERVYRTGDRVSRDEQGNYLFAGRLDDMIKSRGYRIELGDIEQTLRSCTDVESAAAIAIPDDVIGNRIVAFVGAADDAGLASDQVLEHCSARLPGYMVPESITILADLPRTSTGKVDRQKLRNQLPA